jgi:hypothetical protein
MNRLWKATAMMAVDNALLTKLSSAAATVHHPSPFLEMQEQPDATALINIRNEFLLKDKKLMLCLFDLAEINRWLKLDKEPDHKSLLACGTELAPVLSAAKASERDDLTEAAGVMILDKRVRNAFVGGGTTLKACGYTVSDASRVALMTAVDGVKFKTAADTFFANNWPGTNCQSAFAFYPEYVHFNI